MPTPRPPINRIARPKMAFGPFGLALVILLCAALKTPDARAQQRNLYKVSLLRATPGSLSVLIDKVRDYRRSVNDQLVIMRHSQGDHWDLMLLGPAGDNPLARKSFADLVDFQHDFVAESMADWAAVRASAAASDLFHIEMFHAAAGKHAALLRERGMENSYLENTGRKPNVIFETVIGSDTDMFTVGFYENMVAYATDPDLPESVYHKAATDAGFASRSDIGFYLRQFIVGHNDTLASNVR